MKFFNFLQAATTEVVESGKETLTKVAETIAETPVDEMISGLLDKAVSFGLKVLAAFAIFIVGRWIIKKVKNAIKKLFDKKETDAAISSFVLSIVNIALTIILVVATIGVVGIDTSSIAALLTGGGLAIGMALNGTVQNFAGGIMLIIFKPFKSGDFIEAQGFMGTVTDVSITSTKLLTTDNRVIVIPNGSLSSGSINNYSHMPLRRLDLTVDVEYGTQSDKVTESIFAIIKEDSRILDSKTTGAADPFVALSALKSSGIQFTIRVWVKSADYWDVNFAMIDKIYNELPKNGINFPYPKLDVNVKQNS